MTLAGGVPLAGGVALVATLGLLVAIRSRFVRGRLRFSLWLLLASLALQFAVTQHIGDVDLMAALARLAFVLAIVNLVVAVVVNPWRDDRPSDRVPAIVQDVTMLGLFTAIATVLMHEQLLTTSAVGAVVVGFALQDTLGNLFAGLAIQIEKPFKVGQWVRVGEREGLVQEVTWRATKLRTKAGQFLIVPNSVIAKELLLNFSEPTEPTRIEVEVGASNPGSVSTRSRNPLARISRTWVSSIARTVAVLGSPVSIDISPKQPPVSITATSCPDGSRVTRTRPLRTTNIESPAAPCLTIASPAANT